MKKKKIKNALLCALAVPCMFMATGCKDKVEPISVTEYANLVYDAGSNYMRTHSDYKTYGDTTVTATKNMTAVEKDTVLYKANAQATEFSNKEVIITSTNNSTQTIEINRDETENGDIAIKITKTSVDVEKGERANSTTSVLENYETTTDATIVYTLVKTGTEYKMFQHNKITTKETGKDDSTLELKQVKTFESQEEFQEAVETVLKEVDDDLVDDMLSASGEMLFMSPETYKKGDDCFGLTFNMSGAESHGDKMIKHDSEVKYEFRNNLPYSINITTNAITMDGESDNSTESMTITYSASAISAPSDAANYTASNSLTYSDLITTGGY